jgi:hypothetical protein
MSAVGSVSAFGALGTAATVALAVLVGIGPVCGTAAAVTPGRGVADRSGDPYAHGGLQLRLPGGGSVRLVRPGGTAHPSSGSRAPGAAAPKPTGGSKPGGGAKPTAAPSAAPLPGGLPFVPVPLLGPLFHAGAGGPSPTGTRPGAGPSAAARSSAAAQTGRSGAGAGSDAALRDRTDRFQPAGGSRPPLRDGPPPLGPQALAAPPTTSAAEAVPGAGLGSVRLASDRDEQLNGRILPLGVGLALIGAGAALFGWRLRRI